MYNAFFEDMTMIISYIYMVNKLKDWMLTKRNQKLNTLITWAAPFVSGFLSILVIGKPIYENHMVLDLRAVPVFIVAYIGGLRWGMLSAILPILHSVYFEGGEAFQANVLGILMPIIIGAIFHQTHAMNPVDAIVRIKRIVPVFGLYIFMDMLIRPIWLHIPLSECIVNHIYLTLFSGVSLITITLMLNDSNQHRLFEKKLAYFSSHDQLTELPNRTYFKYKLNQFKEIDSPVAIAMIDIDFFKIYNDTHGHVAGDYVLKEIGDILAESIRQDDGFVARYGGEEFIILFQNVAVANIRRILERLRQRVEEYPFQGRETQPDEKITLSIGFSITSEIKDLTALIEEADRALYHSKENGRNQITFYSDQFV